MPRYLRRQRRNSEQNPKSSRSRPGVEPRVHGLQPRFEHVRVNLRRRQVGVAQHHLNRAQVGAAFEQMRGERVADDVRAERARQPRRGAVPFEDLPEPDARQRSAARVDEEPRRRTLFEPATSAGRLLIARTRTSAACSPIGISRSLLPLPMQVR